jgi:RecA-family ATPase
MTVEGSTDAVANEAFLSGALSEVEKQHKRIDRDGWRKGLPYGGAVNPDWEPPLLDPISPCSFQGQPIPERRWLVDGWIPSRTVTMLGGDGGAGKSLCAMQLCAAAASGGNWLGLPVAPMKALYVSCEDEDEELHRRQDAINRTLGIDFADLDGLEWVDRVGVENLLFAPVVDEKGFRGPPDVTDFYRSVMRHAMDNGQQLIVFDSSHDVYGASENDRGQVRRFVQALTRLAREIDGSVILLSHPSLSGRNSGTGESGSTAWSAAVRSRLYLHKPAEDEGADANERLLTRKKANYAAAGDTIRLQYIDGAFVPKDQPGGIVASLDRNRAKTVFLDLLDRREREKRPVSHKPKSGNYAPAEFGKHPNRQGYRKADFAWAMEALFNEGLIIVATYGDRPSRQFEKIAPTNMPME